MGVAMAAEAIEPASALRQQFAERIKAAWHKSREKIIALGRALIEAKQQLAHGEFTAMIETDLPFSPWTARQMMRIALDPRTVANATLLPDTARAMDGLRKLNDEQFEAAIGNGDIHPAMTVKDAEDVMKRYLAPAPYAIEPRPHRPHSAATHLPPKMPESGIATTYSELVALMIAAREAFPIAQRTFDECIGWADGQTGKYEIPHQDDGRVADWKNFFEWAQGLKVGLKVVAL